MATIPSPVAYVFGYGSLTGLPSRPLSRTPGPHGFVADLRGWAREWGVAMDNRYAIPGYKRYRAPDGTWPGVHVCFLDIAQRTGAVVNGVCLPVDDVTLAALDARERNYTRRDVTDQVTSLSGATVFTYVGSAAGRARLARGRRDGDAVIAAAYLATVRAGFAALGEAEARRAAPSLEPGAIPVRELTREDLAT